MSAGNWAGDGDTLPLTSWRDGRLVYVSVTPMPMTTAQAREAAGRILDHCDAIERSDPYAASVQRFEGWKARRAGRICQDCDDNDQPCTCQIAERPYLTTEQTQKLEVIR